MSHLHSSLIQGKEASANQADAEKYKSELSTIVNASGYSAQQLFNMDETGIFLEEDAQTNVHLSRGKSHAWIEGIQESCNFAAWRKFHQGL